MYMSMLTLDWTGAVENQVEKTAIARKIWNLMVSGQMNTARDRNRGILKYSPVFYSTSTDRTSYGLPASPGYL